MRMSGIKGIDYRLPAPKAVPPADKLIKYECC